MTIKTCRADEKEVESIHNEGKVFSMSGDISGAMGYSDFDSDTVYGTELRWQLTAQPTQNLALTARINASRSFDSATSDNDDFMIDRFFVSWDEIGNLPLRLSGGRLPTMGETSPGHLRLGLDQPRGALSSFTDIALDGVALEYRYQMLSPGRLRFYYATQIDAGYESNENDSGLLDTTISGLQWDIFHNKSRSIQLQSFLFADLWNITERASFVNPLEFAAWTQDGTSYDSLSGWENLVLDRQNLGDIYLTSISYLDKVQDLNFFVNLGWSHTNPKAVDELGTSLLSSWWADPQNKDGFSLYAGLRYDIDKLYSTIGFEYNYGSQYWISFSQKAETSKLATRGSVAEVYWTVEPPLPAALANVSQTLIGRLGYQYYDFDYTGSGSWLGEPRDIDELQYDPFSAQFYTPIESAYNIYASVTLYF